LSVFVDTSAFIALIDGEDPQNCACRNAWECGMTEADGFITSDYVTLEAIAVAQRRFGLDAVRTLVDEFFPLVYVEWVAPEDRSAALAALLAAGQRHLSLVDCISFVMMRRMGVREYLGLDPHFDEQGFKRYAAGR
jgi:predicted nucleic acid-binding protein